MKKGMHIKRLVKCLSSLSKSLRWCSLDDHGEINFGRFSKHLMPAVCSLFVGLIFTQTYSTAYTHTSFLIQKHVPLSRFASKKLQHFTRDSLEKLRHVGHWEHKKHGDAPWVERWDRNSNGETHRGRKNESIKWWNFQSSHGWHRFVAMCRILHLMSLTSPLCFNLRLCTHIIHMHILEYLQIRTLASSLCFYFHAGVGKRM